MQPVVYQKKFREREDRTKFILERFPDLLNNSVLDVGCYEAPLRKLLPETDYFGIDFVGDPDLVCNLEEIDELPVENKRYDTTCCFEVLEHLESFHLVFEDLFRTARKNVLVSLPNCWCSARSPIAKGRGGIAHYGIPLEKPKDRHKWFINSEQIINFFQQYAEKVDGIELKSVIGVENERPTLIRSLRRVKYSQEAYLNRYIHTVIGHFSLSDTN